MCFQWYDLLCSSVAIAGALPTALLQMLKQGMGKPVDPMTSLPVAVSLGPHRGREPNRSLPHLGQFRQLHGPAVTHCIRILGLLAVSESLFPRILMILMLVTLVMVIMFTMLVLMRVGKFLFRHMASCLTVQKMMTFCFICLNRVSLLPRLLKGIFQWFPVCFVLCYLRLLSVASIKISLDHFWFAAPSVYLPSFLGSG